MSRSYALGWLLVLAFWAALVWAYLDAGAALVVVFTGAVGWGLGRTWTPTSATTTPSPSGAPRSADG